MEAQELYLKDGKPTGVFYCGKCRIVHKQQESAEECCSVPVCACGKEMPRYLAKCSDCSEVERAEKRSKEIAAAEKVESWDGFVWADWLGGADGYFDSVDDLVSSLEDDEVSAEDWP